MKPVTFDEIGRWSTAARRATWPLRRVWLDVEVRGERNLPEAGGVILAANHLSFLDSVLLMHELPRRALFLGKAEYLDSWWSRTAFTAAGMIPIERGAKAAVTSLRHAVDRLKAGEVVGIFPEGTRSRDGRLHRGHTGVAHLAFRSGAPVVPIGVLGTDAALPPGRLSVTRGAQVSVRLGSPIDAGPWAGRRATGTARREFTDEVMASIAAMTGQTRVEAFAPVPA